MNLITKCFCSTLVSIGALIFLPSAVYSDESVSIELPAESEKSCADAISTVEAELIEKGFFSPWEGEVAPGRAVQVTPEVRRSESDIASAYYGYPTERSQSVSFDLSGEANKLYGLLMSPQLMSILSAQIMAECRQVGLVRFNHWYEGGMPVGYFPDNTVRPFEGVVFGRAPGFVSEDEIEIRTVETDAGKRSLYPWGYYFFI